MRKTGFIFAAVLILALFLPALVLGQGTAMLWDGTQWKDLPQEAKIGYVKGVGNMADYENAASGARGGIISKALETEWKAKTVGQIVQEVDKFYRDNPQKMSLPVIEVMLRCCSRLNIP